VCTYLARVAKEYEAEQQLPTYKEKLQYLPAYRNIFADAYLDQVGKDSVHDGISYLTTIPGPHTRQQSF
jgi:hypothetical protein